MLDYKRIFQIDDDKKTGNRREFVRDVVSFYNSEGGCIIYGIDEKRDDKGSATGYPNEFFDNDVENWDKTERQIYDIIRSNTDPPITNLNARLIKVESKNIIVIGIPRRIGLPAMVTFDNNDNFLKRIQTNKYQVNTMELYQMFIEAFELNKKIEDFVASRISLSENQKDSINVYLHIFPYSFSNGKLINIRTIDLYNEQHLLNPIRGNHINFKLDLSSKYNHEGYKTMLLDNTGIEVSSMQIFRNGVIEYLTTTLEGVNTDKAFMGIEFIRQIIFAIQRTLELYTQIFISPPFAVVINMLNTSGVTLLRYGKDSVNGTIVTDRISMPIVLLENFSYNSEKLFEVLKEYFDIIWQSAGNKEAPSLEDLIKAKLL